VERLADAGTAPNAVYVISPIFDPSGNRYDLSGEEQSATHRIEITHVAGRKVEALGCHASQADIGDELAALKAAVDSGGPIYEGYHRVRPLVPAPHPEFDSVLL
nr:hypothetical protein [Chloroflexota bacterium]